MIKTFTLEAIDHEQETPERGSITWYVSDEKQQKRAVHGVTELSHQGFIKTIRPHNDREIPLVELLSYYVEGESFRIDFSIFNETFGYQPRDAYPHKVEDAQPVSNRMKDSLRHLFHITGA